MLHFFQPAFLLLLLFFMRVVFPQLFSSVFSVLYFGWRCNKMPWLYESLCSGTGLLVYSLSGVESVFTDSAPFAESCLRSYKVKLEYTMISCNCCPIKCNAIWTYNSHQMAQDFPLWIALKCCLVLILKECEETEAKLSLPRFLAWRLLRFISVSCCYFCNYFCCYF